MSYQTAVVEAFRDHGLHLGFCPGWETRGSSLFYPQGAVCHHDAIPTRWATPPGMLISGRPDLAGPLCNTALASDGTVWLVAAGRANHAGAGSWRGLVGNSTVWGTEAQNAGTGQEWPDAQIDAYARLHAALVDFYGWPAGAEMVCRHAEWTWQDHRKIDPWGPWQDGHRWELDASHFRALVAQGGTDMPLNADDLFAVGVTVKKCLDDVNVATAADVAEVQAEVRADRRMMLDIIDATAQAAGVDPAKVRSRLRPETRTALDKVDG